MKTFRLFLPTVLLLSGFSGFSNPITQSDTLPRRSSQSRLAPAPMTIPGTRLDTNFRTLPAQSSAVAKAAPAWLKAKANGSIAFYVVDGKAATADQLHKLKQSEVASVNFLEGNKAASLYGKNARNGMIIITTKAGHTIRD